MDLGLIGLLRHYRSLKADALQGVHQIGQNIFALIGGGLLGLYGEQRLIVR